MKPSSLLHVAVVLVIAAPLLYLAIIWNSIPAVVPIHFDVHMKPDRVANKSELWAPTLIMAACALLVYVLMNNINKIDPKRKGAPIPASFRRLGVVAVVFISAISVLIIIQCASLGHMSIAFLVPAIGLLFAGIGNYLPAIKPNYFAGIRVPSTLRSESNWKKTHQLAGKIWFWGGLGMAVTGLFLPVEAGVFVIIGVTAVITVIPIVYSCRLSRKEKTTHA